MTYTYTLGKKLESGLYELYRDGEKTRAKIAGLDIIDNPEKSCIFIADGIIRGGKIRYGESCCGKICGGIIHGGIIHDGKIYGGEIYDGEIRGGTICNGIIYDGEIYDGIIHGGIIYYGKIRGGTIYDGEIKNPLQIQGSRHYLIYNEKNGNPAISIGCKYETIKWWLENYHDAGEKHGYTAEQVEEYSKYINLFADIYLK